MSITYDYYIDNYLKGKKPIIPQSDYAYYIMQANQHLKQFINTSATNNSEEVINMCACEVAEVLYNNDSINVSSGITAQSTGDVSITYAGLADRLSGSNKQIKCIIYKWLSNTGLLYRGVR